MIKAVYQFLVVFFQIIFPAKRAVRVGGLVIRLLYATAGRSIVAGNGQAYHRAVRQVDRALHQSFAESAPAYDYTSIPILNGSGYDFTGGCGIFIHQNDETAVFKLSVSFGMEITAACGSAFRINNEVLLLQEFIGEVDSGVQIATAISLQVEYQVFHSFFLQLL